MKVQKMKLKWMRNRALKFTEFLSESIYQPGLRIPDHIEFHPQEIEILKRVGWRDMQWKEIGDDGHSIVWLECYIPIDIDISTAVIVDIQLIREEFYQIHISLSESLRGLGLGVKIYRSLIDWLGHVYSGIGRRQNPVVNHIWSKLKMDITLQCSSSSIADICISKKNPKGKELLSRFREFFGD
jgi:hypothetical protein